MIRRNFIAAATGLFGGWFLGPKLLAKTPKKNSPKGEPVWIGNLHAGYLKDGKPFHPYGDDLQFPIYQVREMVPEKTLTSINGNVWHVEGEIQSCYQTIKLLDGSVHFYREFATPGQVLIAHNNSRTAKILVLDNNLCIELK